MQGRKMTPGKYTFDPTAGRMGIFIGYCEHGQKIIINHSDWQQVDRVWHREQKSYPVRLYHHICKTRSI